jgi:ribosomal protein S18 acetylase RimI-like enzyme
MTEFPHPLDNAIWASLTGSHAHFAQSIGQARRYPGDVAPFYAITDHPTPEVWQDLAELAGPGTQFVLTHPEIVPPEEWLIASESLGGVQLVDNGVQAQEYPEAIRLTPADVPEMLELIDRTKPGPFRPRTIELGTYLGIRRDGNLIAMAGERLHPTGWTEISAVCTDAAYRGQGLGTKLVLAVAAGIKSRGETPFMHAAATNVNAIRLYESLGFLLRRKNRFLSLRVPV